MTITLYGWGAMFGLPSPSPYVMKSDIHLQMLGVDFERRIADLESVDKHKAPYVTDGEALVQDSAFIRAHFERRLGLDLDAGLDPAARAVSRSLEAMFENRLAQFEACERWMDDANFARGPKGFFAAAPEAVREAVAAEGRAETVRALRAAGFGRYDRDERRQIAAADIAAASDRLGARAYFQGEEPTGVDGPAFGVLACCANPYFDSDLPALVSERPNLVAYLARMRERFFATDRWPAMG